LIALLEYAEEKRRKDPKYTARRFKREVYGEDEPAGKRVSSQFATTVRRLARMRPADAEGFASAGDPAELEALIIAASERLAVARRSLLPRQRILAGQA
jgi:hypothetical protein